jgi:putative ABC transport system permease protein
VGQTEILRTWLIEAALLGLVGGILGVLGGWVLAQGAVRVVSQTVNALYYATNVEAAGLHYGEAGVAILIAVLCSLAAGWLPAKAAATTPPAQLLNRGGGIPEGKRHFNAPKTGGILLLVASGLTLLPPLSLEGGGHFPLAGYLSALLGILGGGLLAGECLGLFGWLGRPLARHSAFVQLGNSHIRKPTGRHRWAVAGLLCAVAMTGGMAMLVASFERSVSVWIEHTLQADLYITSDANQAATSYNRIPETSWRKILSHPGVGEADVSLILPAELPQGTVRVVGSELAFSKRHNQFTWLVPPQDNAVFDPARNATLCLISEAFAERFETGVGREVRLPTPAGTQTLRIAGVYTDYGDEKGVIMLDRVHLSRWLATPDASTLSIIARPGMDPVQLQAELRREFPGLAVLSNTHLRSEVMRIFRQTFAITYALEGIGVLVALAGLGTTLVSILLERKAELTTLRALGMRQTEIAAATAWEGAWLSVCGTLGGLLVSLGLGAVLIYVVNKQTFGWTLQPVVPVCTLGGLALAVIACGTAVAWSVGRWGSVLPVDQVE